MVKGKRICQLQMLVGLRTRERSSVTERLRGSGGGEEARGNRHTLHHPCAAFVLEMLGSHFDLQLSLLKYRAKGSLTCERDASTVTDLSVTKRVRYVFTECKCVEEKCSKGKEETSGLYMLYNK